jgi:4-amino-4-deoxy-L-arabinose transferase-like glycosyltransferase
LTTIDRLLPWLIVGLGTLLRLAALDLAPFTYDDADLILRARDVASGQLALTGAQTSWGIPDPPLQVYLAAPLAGLPSAALSTVLYFALINSVTVGAFYLVSTRFFGRRVALIATLLLAVNPWALYFSRRAWTELQPALTLLAFWAALELVVAGRRQFALIFFLALAAGVQVRLLAASLAPPALVALALAGRVWLSRWSVLGLTAGALLSLPYLWYLVTERDRIAAVLSAGERGAAVPSAPVVDFIWWVTAGLNLLPTTAGLAGWLDALGLALRVESWLVAALVLGGLLLALLSGIRRSPGWQGWLLVAAWVVLPLVVIAAQRSTLYLHYLTLSLPMLFLLPALALDRLWEVRLAGRWLAPLALLVVVVTQTLTWLALQRILMVYDTDEAVEATSADQRLAIELGRESAQVIGTGEAYGVEIPIRFWLAAAAAARVELAGSPAPLLVVTEGTDPKAEAEPALLEAVLGPELTPRYLAADELVLPLGQRSLMLVTSDVDLAVAPQHLGTRRRLIPLPTLGRGERDGTRLFDLPPRTAAELAAAAGTLLRPVVGAPDNLVAVAFPERPRVGEQIDLVSVWQGAAPASRPSLVLVDSTGQRVAERDDLQRRALHLEPNEALLLRHALTLPDRLGSRVRVLLQSDGQPPIDLGRISVRAR